VLRLLLLLAAASACGPKNEILMKCIRFSCQFFWFHELREMLAGCDDDDDDDDYHDDYGHN